MILEITTLDIILVSSLVIIVVLSLILSRIRTKRLFGIIDDYELLARDMLKSLAKYKRELVECDEIISFLVKERREKEEKSNKRKKNKPTKKA